MSPNPTKKTLVLVLATGVLATFGCTREAARQPRLLLYCGAGLRPAVAEIAKEFGRRHGVTVECDYAGSEVLVSRIKLSGRGDLYMPGDVYYVDRADEEGLIASKKTVCYFVPVILVRKGNPKNVRTLVDLTRPDVKVGLGDPKACAIGRIASKIFAKNPIPEEDVHVKFRSLTVSELGNHIQVGTLDAVIVWDAVAAYFAEHGQVVPIPRRQNVISTVAVGVLRSSEQPEPAAALVEFITSDRGREILNRHHYTTCL
jgi:molybdate transport system substrate-binding protein